MAEMEDEIQKIEQLVDFLNDCNYAYYVNNEPIISDYEFDMKLAELDALEKKTGYILEFSPTQRIGSDLQQEFRTVTRTKVMGSIANCYDMDELKSWLSGFAESFIIEPKYDGTSCSLIYKKGVLVEASTRGDGYKGSDITENVKTIKNIPLHLKVNDTPVTGDYHYNNIYVPEYVEVRGEILMPKSVFRGLNAKREKEGLECFANERNAAAGSLKQLDPKVTAERKLMFKPYGLYVDDKLFEQEYIKYQHNMLDIAEIFGFDEPHYWRCVDANTVIGMINEFEGRFLHEQDYCMDGCVIKLDSVESQNEAGYTQKTPKWAKAFKFKQEQISTKLLDVELQMGMSGQISFVAILDPVEIDGSLVSKATLNNIDYIRKMDIHKGDYVIVQKNGAVIPGVVCVDNERNEVEKVVREYIETPTVCPFCGAVLVKKDEDGAHLYCPNDTCTEKVVQRMNHFAKKECMNIDGLSLKTIRKMNKKGLLNGWQDFFTLTYESLIDAGFGKKVSQKIIDQINNIQNLDGIRTLFALGIPMIGKVTAKRIMQTYGDFEKVMKADVDELGKINGVGQAAANELVSYIEEHPTEMEDVLRLLPTKCKVKVKPIINRNPDDIFGEIKDPSTILNGKTFLATGKLNNFSRDEIKDSVEEHGGVYASTIGFRLDYLIVGEKAGEAKLKKARDCKINMINENQYLEMIGE